MAKQPIDYSTWFTKQQAADAIGVSQKGIERLASAGKLQCALWRRPVGQSIKVYAPEDIERLTHERQPSKEFVLPPANGNGLSKTVAKPEGNPGHLLHALLQTIQKASETRLDTVQTTLLTLDQAAQFTGLTKAYIERLCKSGELGAIKDRGWKIHRARLEAVGR